MENAPFTPIWIVLLAPVAGFLLQAFAGKWILERMGKRIGALVAVLPIAVSLLVGALLTMRLLELPEISRTFEMDGFEWITAGALRIPFELLVDPLSLTMTLIITGVGTLIFIYATAYMAEDRDFARFFTYMNLFVASMLLLVLGNNLGMLFIGWEGVGLCSYLLIGFWYKDRANARAANKAFIVNRIGDWGLMLALFLIVAVLLKDRPAIPDGRLLSYEPLTLALRNVLVANPALATTLALLLFVGAAGKSAQFPLYLWLPDAMAGPTPVSALIHAATMVTSGVFLLTRMHVVFEASAIASAIICMVGAFTAAWAALIAFGQTDIKRVLAYSTVSQLGFMFIACGAGAYWAGMFHVTTHAFFKALLFLGAGAVIYAMAHNQDMRNYGRLYKYLPITFGAMAIGWLAISGFPFLSGFYSKESILGSAMATSHAQVSGIAWAQVAGWIGLGVALLTALYMTRLTALTFFGRERWREIPVGEHASSEEHHEEIPSPPVVHGHESTLVHEVDEDHHELDANHTPREVPATMWVPLVALAILSIGGGWFLSAGGRLEKFLFFRPLPILGEVPHEPHGIPLMALSIGAAVLGLAVGIFWYRKGLPKDQGWDEAKWKPWRRWERDQFGFDHLATVGTTEGGGEIAKGLSAFDSGFIDGIVQGIAKVAVILGSGFRGLQTGYVRLYALVMLLGGLAFIGYFVAVLSSMGGAK